MQMQMDVLEVESDGKEQEVRELECELGSYVRGQTVEETNQGQTCKTKTENPHPKLGPFTWSPIRLAIA